MYDVYTIYAAHSIGPEALELYDRKHWKDTITYLI